MFTTTYDTTPPTNVSITAVPNGAAIALNWNANVSVAGLRRYDVDASMDGGAWQSVVSNTTATSASYTAQPGHRYTFRVTVTDNAGNSATAQTQPVTVRSVTKYYAAAGRRVAMRENGVVY